jgi:stage II sporulation protein AA (anti-sigma F factor antagonist)
MSDGGFDFEVDEGTDRIDVRVRGELDTQAVFRLEPTLDELPERSPSKEVVFDLRELTFVDSSGLGVLVATDERLRGQGASTRFLRPPEPVMRVFKLAALDEALPFEEG